MTITTQGKELLFATQTTSKLQYVRKLAAAVKREYDIADTADKAAINSIVDELVVLAP